MAGASRFLYNCELLITEACFDWGPKPNSIDNIDLSLKYILFVWLPCSNIFLINVIYLYSCLWSPYPSSTVIKIQYNSTSTGGSICSSAGESSRVLRRRLAAHCCKHWRQAPILTSRGRVQMDTAIFKLSSSVFLILPNLPSQGI